MTSAKAMNSELTTNATPVGTPRFSSLTT
jgi:hypothetical protein